MRAFSEESFRKQLTTPGMILFVGKRQGEVISAHLVTRHDAVAYSHLAASTPEGYQNSAAYGVYWKTMEYLASQGVHWFNIGAAAGVATSSTYDTGLGSFKHGWTTMSRPVYFCGKVFDALRYAAICRECRVGPTDYFPAYRKNEFDSDDPPAKREEEASSSSGNIRNIIGRVVREKRRLVIWGAADHALVVASAVRAWKEYTVVGFIDSINPERRGESFGGSTILGGREVLEDLRRDGVYHVTFGFGSCSGRLSVGDFLLKEGFEVPVIIHPDAIVAPEATFDVGTFFGPASSVSIECRIGRFVIINDGAVICHHAQLGDGVHICPGVVLAGRVNVGRGTWVGISACVRDHISIGADSYIGTGSVVVKDIPDGVLAYGNPARVIRKITEPF
jgi:sugar O-acyltransferase (sialic acid O-acetyltransferase NeuD family)